MFRPRAEQVSGKPEQTRFVLIANAIKVGYLVDATDVYALQRGESKRIARAPYGEWIPIVKKVSAEITKQQLNTGSGLWSIRRKICVKFEAERRKPRRGM